ncbi:glycoside hydrolase superfamily [Mycena vulgaris]|nr:glycoside hydrolase superfamily [Mycena vulgaris]
MGFDAIWISPVGLNLENTGGEGYHGYWSTDPTRLNSHFGDEASLLALFSALHRHKPRPARRRRGPAAIPADRKLLSSMRYRVGGSYKRTGLLWTDAAHGVPLMDLATETDAVRQVFYGWVPQFVKKFSIVDFRIDEIWQDFVKGFCLASGVFCTVEVSDDDLAYQSAGIDSVLSFPMMYGIQEPFSGNSSWRDINKVAFFMFETQTNFVDLTVLGTFTENHDQSRLWSLTDDLSLTFNVLVTTFQFTGGKHNGTYLSLAQSQFNHEVLWLCTDYSANAIPTYGRIVELNKLRKYLAATSDFLIAPSTRPQQQAQDLAVVLGSVLTILSNRGSGSGSANWLITTSGFPANQVVIEIFTCVTSVVQSSGLTVTIKNGLPMIFILQTKAQDARLC